MCCGCPGRVVRRCSVCCGCSCGCCLWWLYSWGCELLWCSGVVVSGVVCQQPRPRARPRRRGVVSRPWERSRRALKPLCVVNCLGCCGCRGWCGLRMVLWLSLVLLLCSCWRIVVLESLDGVWYRLDGTVGGFWVPSVVESGG